MMRPLIVALILSTSLLAQSFTDDDFDFTITPPDGLRMLPEAERALFFAMSPAVTEEMAESMARNVPRVDTDSGMTAHTHIWVEATGGLYRRQVFLRLVDGPLPFRSPEDFANQFTREGLAIDAQLDLRRPLGPGRLIEGTWTTGEGLQMRKMAVCIWDPGQERFAILQAQALASDWVIVRPQIMTMLDGIDWDRGVSPLAQSGTGAGAESAPDPGDWSSLEVVGSLALAIAMLGHLILERS